ncbi:MAG: twin-arginine translocase TatA/TatE family subunit [Microbacterium sp.]|uniref:twin-arginine translocase TatA/TatE family subunit n=1 Tax=Microbacterium sp. TaxID=51671 RepID=UPI0039E6483C
MFGLTFEKLFVIAVIAAIVIGPQRLPALTRRLAETIRALRGFVESTRARAEDEMGVSLQRADWQSLDLRQYDPRRIVRDALAGSDTGASATSAEAGTSPTAVPSSPASEAPVSGTPGSGTPTDARPAAAPTDAASETTAADSGTRPAHDGAPTVITTGPATDAAAPVEPLFDPAILAEASRIHPGQRYLVSGGSAHPRRILIESLPEDDPRRLAARVEAPVAN